MFLGRLIFWRARSFLFALDAIASATLPEPPSPGSKMASIPWIAAASRASTSSGTVDSTVGAGVGATEGAGDGATVGAGEVKRKSHAGSQDGMVSAQHVHKPVEGDSRNHVIMCRMCQMKPAIRSARDPSRNGAIDTRN